MTDTATVEVEGADNLQRTLRRAGDELADLEDANRQAGDVIASAARARAPRRSGRLASSLQSSVTKGRGSVTSAEPYAGPIHWGWPARNIRSQPFLMEAAAATEGQWFGAYEKDAQAALDKVRGV